MHAFYVYTVYILCAYNVCLYMCTACMYVYIHTKMGLRAFWSYRRRRNVPFELIEVGHWEVSIPWRKLSSEAAGKSTIDRWWKPGHPPFGHPPFKKPEFPSQPHLMTPEGTSWRDLQWENDPFLHGRWKINMTTLPDRASKIRLCPRKMMIFRVELLIIQRVPFTCYVVA